MNETCPGCGGHKSKRAELCSACRVRANELGAKVIASVAAPIAPFAARTETQNRSFHGRIREIALLEEPTLAGDALWTAERRLKKWAVAFTNAHLVGREIKSSTDLSELEFERMLDWLSDVIDEMRVGNTRPLT